MGRPWTASRHLCLSYRDEDEYRTLLTINLLAALEQGERIIYLSGDVPVDVVHAWLRDTHQGIESLVARGQLLVRQGNGFCEVNGTPGDESVVDLLDRESAVAARAGYTGLRVSVTRTHLPRDDLLGWERLLQHEERFTRLLANGNPAGLTLTCQYDQHLVPEHHLGALRQAHPVALTAEEAARRQPLLRADALPGQRGLRLSGEINRSNLVELSAALESTFRGDDDIHLDLADLHYADVAAVRLLAQTARRLHDGRRFVLHCPGPIISAILRIYGWDRLPALLLSEGKEAEGKERACE
ncbi:MEDS domain-containing protein [Allokutzneria albata]|uniref:Anti-anti-sigma factor n=1 Tax=Allokutzneria albata TaxID=211114 RepID=A0A1H0CH63_ALLAB|nr:MEDS domain-containing protein [Allokutzneria albata]SDN57172.1 anti-anti-sigma factor [Allokutzneria albata]